MIPTDSSAIERFRAAVLADSVLERRLGGLADRSEFVAVAVAEAVAHGIALDPAALEQALAPDPLGLERFTPRPVTGDAMPGAAWLPGAIVESDTGPAIEWFYLGDRSLREPFYEDSLRGGRFLPISRLIRHRTPLASLPASVGSAGAVPDGLIFHLSRCGSTLVSQMIAALPDTVALSEPAPFDWVLQHAHNATDQPLEQRLALVRAMASALGRHATGGRHCVIKLDSWHTLAMPLLAQAFPATPWIFLYRDPTEIMVSQFRQRGFQTVQGAMGPDFYGIAGADLSQEDYCARVFERTSAPVLESADFARGLLVNYAQLPDAVEDVILPHFGIAVSDAGRAAMAEATGRNAKAPYESFTPDSAAKQQEASGAIRAAVAQHLAEPYRRLEMLRTAG